jgi:hypothetical protein
MQLCDSFVLEETIFIQTFDQLMMKRRVVLFLNRFSLYYYKKDL